ncbi:SNF2 family N-terminal domain-containing protein [Aspergillus californicus]
MDSTSMVIPSTSEPGVTRAFTNGYSVSAVSHAAGFTDGIAANDNGSTISHYPEDDAVSESSADADPADDSYNSESHDAEGDDDDYGMENSVKASSLSIAENSSSPEPTRGTKRKSPSVNDAEYIRQHPDLYGLRRSGRSHPTRKLADSSSDEDSDDVAPRSKRQRPIPSQLSSKAPSRSATQSTYSDDSGSDEYGGNRARANKAKRRRLLQSSASSVPSHAEVRFSTRNAARVSNYNEDDEDSMFEDDVDDTTPNYWVNTEEDDRPAVDVVLNHRPRPDVDPSDPDIDRHQFEFYIKWQGKSHYHATWETTESLANCRSMRRLDNYIRKTLTEDLRLNYDDGVPPEDREKWNLDRERDVDAIEDHKNVERVIGMREGDDGTEYLVKWKRLFYDSCTWESEELVSNIAQREVDRFLDRSSRPPVSDKMESNPPTRRQFEPIKGTPSFLQNGELKEFQVKGVNFMAFNWVKGRNVVLADEMGLGKTVQTVAFISWLRHVRRQQGPFVVVVPLSTMPSWAETFDNWSPDLNYVVYNGNEASRNVLKEHELMVDGNPRRPKFNVLLTTYEYVMLDSVFLSQFKWQFMAIDEAHRLKNRDSQLYVKLVEFKAPARLLITGTPIQNNLAELSALLDFLNPGMVDIDADMDLNAEAASSQLAELTKAIQPFMLRRTKSKVESDLPPKTEKIIRVELSDVQLEYYKNILTKNYAALNEGTRGQKQSLLNIMMELKKASNHPFMFPNAEDRILGGSLRREDVLRALITSSGKMMLLDQLLAKLKRDGHRVLIFSQMVKMLDILGDYMEFRGYTYQRLDGTIPSSSRRLAIEHFNAPASSDFAFILSTRAGGLGINLMTADTVVLFDSDWNPQADLQAMARAHRIGQTRPVSVYRLVSKDTVEEEVIERARNKLLLEFITIQRGVTDKEATEIQNKMARGGITLGEPNSTDDISRILKRRGQRMFEQTGNQEKLEQLDIDSVLANAELHQTEQAEEIQADGGEEFLKAFEYVDIKVDDLSWDDIIPREQLEEIKADEKKKADARYLEDVIEQNRPRKRLVAGDEKETRAERKAKRQARVQVSMNDEEDGDDSETNVQIKDPKRPLLEKEYRHLLRAFLRYGDIDDREDDVIREARLTERDRDTVKAALREITDKAATLVREDVQRLEALENAGKVLTKKERKAVLFDLHGVKRLNAYTIVERPTEMRLLKEAALAVPDFRNFRIPEATKAPDYSCSWGAKEDGMLCVGISRHGYGAWTQIRDDHELGLGDKFFLEEHRVERKNERLNADDKTTKSPGAVHLVRRSDYLLSILRDKSSNGSNAVAKRAVENHHRNARKGNSRPLVSASLSGSPAPSLQRKGQREQDRTRHRSHTHGGRESMERHHTPNRDSRPKSMHEGDRRHRPSDASSEDVRRRKFSENGHSASKEDMSRRFFKPIREDLRKVADVTKDSFPNKAERAAELRRLLNKIGDFINSNLRGGDAGSLTSLETRLWHYVSINYWPNKDAGGAKLQEMYQKLVVVHKKPATNGN